MIPKIFPSDDFKKPFGDVPASFAAVGITRQHNWLEVINDLNQDIQISMNAKDTKTRIIPQGHVRVYEKDAFDVLRYKYLDSAPTSGNVYFNCEYRTYKK